MIKKTYILLLISALLFQLSVKAQSPFKDTVDCSDQLTLAWVKTAGDIDVDFVNDIDTDAAGNVYITGLFRGNMDFQSTIVTSAGGSDFFLAKLDSDGNLVWIETGGGPQDDYGTGVVIDGNNNVFVTGTYGGTANFDGNETTSIGSTDIFLIKYTQDGAYTWGKFIGGFDDDESGGICIDNSNNPIITGSYYFALSIGGTNVISKGGTDFFIAKYDNSGNYLWTTNHGSAASDYGKDVACDNSNNVFVSGEFDGTIVFNTISLVASGTTDVFFAKYNQFGDIQWAKQVGTAGNNDKAYSVATDNLGNSYISYKLDQAADNGRVSRYTALGTNDLNIGFGGTGTVHAYGLTVDNAGSMYVSGMFSNVTDFGDGDVNVVGGSDYFIVKYNADGSFGFKDIAGSALVDAGTSICLDQSNNILVGGFCNNGMYFGATPYTAQGKEDVMVVKYDRYFSFGEINVSSINCDPNNMCIDITVVGGLPPLDYYWSSGETIEDICGLSAGSYQIIVTDENDCFIETTVDVAAPVIPVINMPSNISACPFDTLTLDAGFGFTNYLWSTSENTQTIEVFDPDTYTVTVMDENSCTATASTVVTKLSNINLLVDDYAYVCVDDEISFSVDGFMEYLWIDGSTNSTYTTGDEGLHWVRTYNGICYYYDTIQVINYPKPTVDLGGDQLICSGDSIQLIADAGYVSYVWQDFSTNEYFWASEAGLVSVNIIDSNGCEATDAITITLEESVYVNLGADTTYCSNAAILLEPGDQGDNTYLWSTGETTSTIEVISTNQYWVEVTNLAGCVSQDTVLIAIFPSPIADLGDDIDFCEGGSATISLVGTYVSYLWSDGTTLPTVLASETGMFSVTITDENGCEDYDTVFILEHIILIPFLGYDTTLCVGDVYELSPQYEYDIYNWSTGGKAGSIYVTQAGFYAVTVSDDYGCSQTASINIDYAEYPTIINVDTGGAQIEITAVGGTEPYVYSHDGDTWQLDNTFVNFPPGFYIISVMDKNYCLVTVEAFLDGTINVPSFFTPNGDGYNDYWVISGLFNYPSAEVQIFDRYGKKLYEFRGGEFGWNGEYMERPLPSDTYWYTIRLMDGKRPFTGHVTIKR